MNIAIAQLYVEAGKCEDNFARLKHEVQQAKNQNVDIIVFPEMCISGYVLQDYLLDDEFCSYVHSFNNKVKALSDGIGIIFGNLYYDDIKGIEKGRDGRKPRYNTALFAYNNEWVKKESKELDGIHIKQLNPDYRFFDDSRYFLSGLEVCEHAQMNIDDMISPFIFKAHNKTYRIGLEVCEDLWSFDYRVDVTSVYTKQEVDMIINVSSSPYTRDKEIGREKAIKRHVDVMGEIPTLVYCNAVGMQNTGKSVLLFDGDSCVYDKQGNQAVSLQDNFKPQTKICNIDDIKQDVEPKTDNKVLQALTTAIYEFDKQMFPFKPQWVIGLSGGLDSTINAGLLTRAIGKDRVVAYNLASKYNSATTINNAEQIAKNLGITLHNGSIEDVTSATETAMKAYGYKEEYNSLVYENIQARVRGHLLSTFASIENGVIVNNGNKIEVALGYCTLYGDTIGALSPLGDLTKQDLFTLGKQLNDDFKKEVVPLSLLPELKDNKIVWDMPPSAELKDAQVDPMKWYYHDYIIQYIMEYPTGRIEDFMEAYINNTLPEDIKKWITYYHLDDGKAFMEDLEWLLKKLRQSVFKRIQMPPIVVMSRGSFGSDYREAQLPFIETDKYRKLKAEILNN